MTTNPGNARDSATGVRSARTHTVSSEHTAASAVRHFVSAERNYAIGQQYLANNDPDLQLAGEQHLRLATEQMAVFDDRARLTAGHQAAASKDAKEG